MSLLPECHRWSERALRALGDDAHGRVEEMHLQASLGISLMHMRGESDVARAGLNRGLKIAEERADALNQAGLLGILHNFHFRSGDFKTALGYAKRCRDLAASIENTAATALAHSILGRTLHYMGDLGGASAELEALMRVWPASQRNSTIYLGYDRHYRGAIHLARNLWLEGHSDQAAERAHRTIAEAEAMDHPTSLVVVFVMASSVFLWRGDLRSAERYIDASIAHAESHSLGPLVAVGQARKAELVIRRGNPRDGVPRLRAALGAVHAVRYDLLGTEFYMSLYEGLITLGETGDAATVLDEATARVERNGDVSYAPELWRLRGRLFRESDEAQSEACFAHSLELSRSQGARAWELRTATDLAALWARQRRTDSARQLLQPVFEQFTEGRDTADVQAAQLLLAALG